MSISFACECGKKFRAGLGAAGKRIRCPACAAIVTVPPSSAEAPEEPAPPTPDEEASPPAPAPKPTHAAPVADAAAWLAALERYKSVLHDDKPGTSPKEYAYWLLLLAFIPLAISLTQGKDEPLEKRVDRSFANSPAAQDKLVKAMLDGKELSLDELILLFPEQRLEGAFLPRKTWWHWVYGLLAAAGFLSATMLLFPLDDVRPAHLFFVGLFTGTIGLVLLLIIQVIAAWTSGRLLISRNIIFTIIYGIAFGIGFSYRSALDPDTNFVVSLLGFTFGVGLCEEACKAIPLIWHFRTQGTLSWRAASAWGFASGAGFGVAEGIIYSADFYNGIQSGDIYIVRFVSCVALHGIWTASVGLFLCRHREFIQADFAWHDYFVRTLVVVSVPMLLHGVYDTLLKKEMNLAALFCALASFAWFVWSLQGARRNEEEPEPEPKRRPLVARH